MFVSNYASLIVSNLELHVGLLGGALSLPLLQGLDVALLVFNPLEQSHLFLHEAGVGHLQPLLLLDLKVDAVYCLAGGFLQDADLLLDVEHADERTSFLNDKERKWAYSVL